MATSLLECVVVSTPAPYHRMQRHNCTLVAALQINLELSFDNDRVETIQAGIIISPPPTTS